MNKPNTQGGGDPTTNARATHGIAPDLPPENFGSVREAVDAALRDHPAGWRKSLAESLASALDDEPNASMARELRVLMDDMADGTPREVSRADELRAKRAARQAGTEAS